MHPRSALKDYVTLLPSADTVVEILEIVPAGDLVKAACHRLKEAGYLVALDDFGFDDPRQPLVELADIHHQGGHAAHHARTGRHHGETIWAVVQPHAGRKSGDSRRISGREKAGFVYFQGYFFRKPELMQTSEIPSNRMNDVRMLQAVSRPELDLREVEEIIKSEASLCYRLLRYLNSAAFGFSNEIHSVRHALSMLGEREARRWIRLVATLAAGQDISSELVLSALVRARFCELLSPKIPHGESDLFLMGLLSMMDAIPETPMVKLLEKIPLDQPTKAALPGGVSPLRPLYQLTRESGDWENTSVPAKQLHLDEAEIADSCWQAMQRARQVSGG